MNSEPVQTKKIAETFDELAHDKCCEYKSKGLTASSVILLDYLFKNKLEGKTLLDIGCGTGFFALETLRHGAASCVGLDISQAAIREANELAKELGLQDRAKFEVANAASTPPLASDVVVMDKVLCCYPDVDALLKNAASSSRQLLGFVIPREEGWMKPFMRTGAAVINLLERLRKTGFKFYLHSLDAIHEQLVSSGFQQIEKAKSRIWLVCMYKRARNNAPSNRD